MASNFTLPAKKIAAAFEKDTGHKVVLSFASTGKLYTQITNGAPYDIFLAADAEHPAMTIKESFAIPGTEFTYAFGKIALYSTDPSLVDTQGNILRQKEHFKKIAIANPKTAPYGLAAIDILNALGMYDSLKEKLIFGDNIAQAFQFVYSGNAELGFIAMSQTNLTQGGSLWIIPDAYYNPIRQNAVLLKKAAHSEPAMAFLEYLKTPKAKAIIKMYGYGID